MSDLDDVMRSGSPMPPPDVERVPRLRRFIWIAAALVAVASAIELFWPLPKSAGSAYCLSHGNAAACIKR